MPISHRDITMLGMAHRRIRTFPFGIGIRDRLSHMYIIGQTGTGKSTLIEHLAHQDAQAGRGFCLIDPHGDLAKRLAHSLQDKAIFWQVPEPTCRLGYNPLTHTTAAFRPLVAAGLIDALKKQWSDAWGVRMEHLLRYAILALLEHGRTDLRDILQMYLDRDFRNQVLARVSDEQVIRFWRSEFPAMNYKTAADGIAPIANKLGAFLAHPVVRHAICDPEIPLRFRDIMDKGQILIVSLEKGRLGSDTANVLGGLLVSSIVHAAFTRTIQGKSERRPFMLYIDEFHSFTTETLAELLSETRKYHLAAILAQQHTQQSSQPVFSSVMGNTGNLVCFRTGALDAPIMAHQLGGIDPHDIMMQANFQAFVRILVDGERTRSFSMTSFPPIPIAQTEI